MFAKDWDSRRALREELGLRPPFEITYALVLQKNGHYHVRITAGNATPIIVGGFPSRREAEAWLEAEEHDAGDSRDTPKR